VRGLKIGDWSEVGGCDERKDGVDLDGRMEDLGVCGGAEYAPVSTIEGLRSGRFLSLVGAVL
jgi:hypothetical protein